MWRSQSRTLRDSSPAWFRRLPVQASRTSRELSVKRPEVNPHQYKSPTVYTRKKLIDAQDGRAPHSRSRVMETQNEAAHRETVGGFVSMLAMVTKCCRGP